MKNVTKIPRTLKLVFSLTFLVFFIACQTTEDDELIISQEEFPNETKLYNYLINELDFDSSQIQDKGDTYLVDDIIEFTKNEFYTADSGDNSVSSKASTRTIYRFLVNLGRHYYDQRPIFDNDGTLTFIPEGNIGRLKTSPVSGTVALYYMRHNSRVDQLFTTNRNEVVTNNNPWQNGGIYGYIYTNPASGRKPVYRYYSRGLSNHFYTTNYNELRGGRNGYVYEGITGYTLN